MGRPKEHGEETRTSLLEAAERIAENEGIDAISVRRLADEVGTTTRAIYSVFGSKEGLLVALGAEAFAILRDNLESQKLTGDAAADMAMAGFAFRAFATQHPVLFRLAVQRELPDPALAREFAAAANATFGALVARVQRFADAGLLHGIDARAAAVQYHSLCEGLAAVELRQPGILDPAEAEQTWRDALARLVTGFQHGPAGVKRRRR